MKQHIDYCILIPILNEVENISELTNRVLSSVKNKNYLLVYIDDGSTDGTLDILSELIKQNDQILLIQRKTTLPGCQRGGALYYGIKELSQKYQINYWIEMDGDLSHTPEEIPNLIKQAEINNWDVVIVSKYLSQSKIIGRHLFRNLISQINSWIFRLFVTKTLTDFSNGYRLYNEKAAMILLTKNIRYSTPIYLGEVLMYWIKGGLKIGEIPGVYIGRKRGNSTVTFLNILEGFWGSLKMILLFHSDE